MILRKEAVMNFGIIGNMIHLNNLRPVPSIISVVFAVYIYLYILHIYFYYNLGHMFIMPWGRKAVWYDGRCAVTDL